MSRIIWRIIWMSGMPMTMTISRTGGMMAKIWIKVSSIISVPRAIRMRVMTHITISPSRLLMSKPKGIGGFGNGSIAGRPKLGSAIPPLGQPWCNIGTLL